MSDPTEREALADVIRQVYDTRNDMPERVADAILASDLWRTRQTENGSCWDEGPTLPVREGECEPMPPLCELRAGHAGAHRGGRAEWMTRPATRPVITDDSADRWPTDHREPNAVLRALNEARQQGFRAALEAAFGENHEPTEEEHER